MPGSSEERVSLLKTDDEWGHHWYQDENERLKKTPDGRMKYEYWSEGMNSELREAVGRVPPNGNDKDPRIPPAYYAESSMPVRVAKAFMKAMAVIAPYFAVFDQLSGVGYKDWLPCNNQTCHYVRIFNSEKIPGTGSNVMAVQNGVDRPVAMDFHNFNVYSCPYIGKNGHVRTYSEKLQFWKPSGHACSSPYDATEHHKHTHDAVVYEQKRADGWTASLRLSFKLTKSLFWAASVPMNWMAKSSTKWGMEHIPNARCPNMSREEMKKTCDLQETREAVINHLAKWSPSKYALYGGLAGFFLLTAIHDLLLMRSTDWEYHCLLLGAVATGMLGISCAAVFMWAMGATEVFVAPIKGQKEEDCMCFYQLPELTSLMGLATPFALYAVFRAQVQMRGLACLFGDYLNWITFIVPHYLARQSFLWTWGTMTTPKTAGTVAPTESTTGAARDIPIRRMEFKEEHWVELSASQYHLYTGSNILGVIVAFSASSFMICFKEVCVGMYKHGGYTGLINNVIKYVLLPAPSLAALGIGGYALFELYQVVTDKTETMIYQLMVLLPKCVNDCLRLPKLDKERIADTPLRWIVGISFGAFITLLTVAAAQGLCPNLSFLRDFEGTVQLEWTSLVQAELWSACGFVFFLIHVPRVLAIAFSTWDDLESLKHMARLPTNQVTYLEGENGKKVAVPRQRGFSAGKNDGYSAGKNAVP